MSVKPNQEEQYIATQGSQEGEVSGSSSNSICEGTNWGSSMLYNPSYKKAQQMLG